MQAISSQETQEELRLYCKLSNEGHSFCFWDAIGKVLENILNWVGFSFPV